MTIYIEYVLIDNIVMDYVILRLMELTTGRKYARASKLLVCIIGGCMALFLPLIINYKLLSFLYKICTSIILVLCIKRYKKFKEFISYYLMFFAYTFFVGGMCLGVIELMGIEYTMSSVVMYNFDYPFGVFALILIVVIKVMTRTVKLIKNKFKNSTFMYKVKIVDEGRTVSGYGFLDTGNLVSYNGQGVAIITIDMFRRLHEDIKIEDIILKKIKFPVLKDIEYIDISGVGDGAKCLSFVADYLEVEGRKIEGARLAVVWKSFGDFEMVLHKDCV